jgi:RNA polymerase sigma-70 factor (ECF subfamily)
MPTFLRLRPRTSTVEPVDRGVSDAELVVMARSDRQAFGLLYDRYKEPVFGFCLRQLVSREAAEDATSAIFTKALAGLPRYRETSFRGWLFTIAFHEVSDRRRTRRPDPTPIDGLDVVDEDATPEEVVLRGETDRSVRDLVAQLPPNERRVVELRLSGLTDSEIATVLGLAHGNVRVIQHRAIKRLRALRDCAERSGVSADG